MTSGSVGRRAKVKEKRNEEREGGVRGRRREQKQREQNKCIK